MSALSPASRRSSWRRPALLITLFLTALVCAVAIAAISAVQLTERATAQHFLSRAVMSLLEIDHYVESYWPLLEEYGAEGQAIPLDDFPIALQLDPAALADGPDAVAQSIADATASLIYDDGFETLSESPQILRLVSSGGAFDVTVGRLTDGGRTVAVTALIVSGILALLMLLATAAQCRGLNRFTAPALALAVGAAVVWAVAFAAQAIMQSRADAAFDPFTADLLLIASDAVAFAVRNAAVTAVAAAVAAAVSIGCTIVATARA